MIIRLEIKNCNKETAKISALLSGEVDKHEHLTAEEILPSNQSQLIKQSKSTHSLLEKAFKKRKKINRRLRKKTSWTFKSLETSRTSTEIKISWKYFSKKSYKMLKLRIN